MRVLGLKVLSLASQEVAQGSAKRWPREVPSLEETVLEAKQQ